MKLAQIEPKAQENQETVWNEINQENLKKKQIICRASQRRAFQNCKSRSDDDEDYDDDKYSQGSKSALPPKRSNWKSSKAIRFAIIFINFFKFFLRKFPFELGQMNWFHILHFVECSNQFFDRFCVFLWRRRIKFEQIEIEIKNKKLYCWKHVTVLLSTNVNQ